MVTNKHIEKIIAAVMAAAVLLCFALMLCAGQLAAAAEKGITMEYETKLFGTGQVIDINILIDDDQWQQMLDNAIAEEYVQCDVEVNGTTFYRVALRPKGNTSLSSIAMDSTTDRYSFKLEFDKYVKVQTCFGLDKLILNNNYADATNMKEALVYDMYHYIGADASLSSFARISVNGEYRGVYLALEAVEDSFLLRNYGTEDGRLYKPESMNMGGGGANLNYTDDDLDSYSTIWESAVNSSGKADHKRVVTALKNIAEGSDRERYMDIDNLLKYIAVHVLSVNEDSLSGMMAHNYYLYEHDGRLNLIPWDYNLILGGMGSGGNFPGGAQPAQTTPADSGRTGEDSAADLSASDKSRPSFGGQGDGGRFPSGSQPTGGSANVRTNLITIGVSFGVLLAAIVIAKTYRRKNIRK